MSVDVYLRSTALPSGNDVWLRDPTIPDVVVWDIFALGIASAEAFGLPIVSIAGGAAEITPVGIYSLEAVGSPAVGVNIFATGIGSLEAFGQPQLGGWLIPALPLEEARLGVYYRNRLRLAERWLEIHANDAYPAPGAGGVQ